MPALPPQFPVAIRGRESGIPADGTRVFEEREAFLITALSCNVHEGWDPSLHDRFPHPQCCGPDKRGNAFGHAVNMERILHGASLPITWMIDAETAQAHLPFFLEGRERHGDEIALMPPSRSHFNSINWNTERTLEETEASLRRELEAIQALFPFRITTLGIDQFIGSVGTHFTQAAAALGFTALWGVGFDHAECDTSMHHFGCPWDCYRPSRANFRIPGADALPLWMFQWTTRDLINSVRVPGGMSGAVMFSTDVDDILACEVAAHQPDYYHRLVGGLLANRGHNDFLSVMFHQEDHDSWKRDGLAIYERFFSHLPEGLTPATMGEVAGWLDQKFPRPAQPAQAFRLEDVLTCKEHVTFPHPGVYRPQDWGLYPPHVFLWDEERQLIFVEGSSIPFRILDYRKAHAVPETGAYPAEPLAQVTVHRAERVQSRWQIEIECEEALAEFPLALWTEEPPPAGTTAIPGGWIALFSVPAGRHMLTL